MSKVFPVPRPAEKKPGDIAPAFTAAQVAEGKKGYEGYCAVCHGSTLANGTFGTPLAGAYFKKNWYGKHVGDFYEKSRTMPPAAPKSLSGEAYANIVAYILEYNGFKQERRRFPQEATPFPVCD